MKKIKIIEMILIFLNKDQDHPSLSLCEPAQDTEFYAKHTAHNTK